MSSTTPSRWSASPLSHCATHGRAPVFNTHHGLNSIHEAIFHRAPMIPYPLFSDQPGLARHCQELGLAVPLVESPRRRVKPADVRAPLECVAAWLSIVSSA